MTGSPLRGLRLPELRRRTSEKWLRYPPDVLPMWVAEMDSGIAEPIAEAITGALALGDLGYAHGSGHAEALAGFAARRWGWRVDVTRTAPMPDVMLGVVEVLKLFTAPGDTVVVSPPVYPPFYKFLRSMGLRVAQAPLTASGRLDPATLADAFRDASAYLLCNPQNPTGVAHTREELTALAALANHHGVRVVADEIHAPLVLPGAEFVPYLTVPGSGDAFSLMSASKAWNLAGLKAAVAIAGEAAAADLARLPEEVADGVSHLGEIAHVAAWRDGEPWLDALLADLDANRDLLGRLLAEHAPRIGHRPMQATYLAWLDCRDLGLGDDPAAVFLERGRVAFYSGHLFGSGGAGHVRMNLATSPELIEEGVRRMTVALRRPG